MRYVIATLVALTAGAGAKPKREETPQEKIKYVVGMVCENSQASDIVKSFMRSDAILLASGVRLDLKGDLPSLKIANLHAPGKVTVDLDTTTHTAWFQAACEGKAVYKHSERDCAHAAASAHCDPYKITMHASGLVIDDDGWKIALMALTATDSDQLMISRGDNPLYPKYEMPKSVTQTGDAGLAKAVVAWFASGDLGKFAASGTVFANGSAPEELANGAAAMKLVAKWDKMKLALVSVDAAVGPGDRGVVHATVRWLTKKKTIIQLDLTAFAVRDGETWKWVVLDFVT